MDYEQRKISELRRKISGLNVSELDIVIRGTWGEMSYPEARSKAQEIRREREECYRLLDQWESRYLLRRAESYGIEVQQRPEWRKVDLKETEDGITQIQAWLNEEGKAMINKQIRDARFQEWKRKADLLVPILALLVAALALFKDIIVEVLKNKF